MKKIVIKNNKVIAIHENYQEIESNYLDCQIIIENSINFEVGQEYIITSEIQKNIDNEKIKKELQEIDIKSIRSIRENLIRLGYTDTYLTNYDNQAKAKRNNLK